MADVPSRDIVDTRPWYFNEYTGLHGAFVQCLATCPHDRFVDGMNTLLGVTIGPGHVITLNREPRHPLGPNARSSSS